MAEGKCASCARYLLVILNLIFWLTGALFLAVGIWLVTSDVAIQTITDQLHLVVNLDTLQSVGYAVISIGSFMFLIGFCGCCGAIRESAIMIGVYIIFMVVLLCGELATIVYVALEKSAIEAKLRDQLMSDVQNYTATTNMSNLDFIQAKFECCGVDNFTNYRSSYYFQADTSYKSAYVPDSCCLTFDHETPFPADRDACQQAARLGLTNDPNLFTQGCFKILEELIGGNNAILLQIVAAILILEIVGIVFAVFLCRHRTDYDYDYDD